MDKLSKARNKLDDRVFKFIQKKAPLSRLMNLHRQRDTLIPAALKENSIIANPALRDEEIIKRSLQRLKKAGRIWCNKGGTPHWEICEEPER
jgi:hypothetical protein